MNLRRHINHGNATVKMTVMVARQSLENTVFLMKCHSNHSKSPLFTIEKSYEMNALRMRITRSTQCRVMGYRSYCGYYGYCGANTAKEYTNKRQAYT